MTILVTGGSGFIGSNFILHWLHQHDESVVSLDKITYAGGNNNLNSIAEDPRYSFIKSDIADSALVAKILRKYSVRAIINFAAESHVDRSLQQAESFVQSNIVGTHRLLEATREYWMQLDSTKQHAFRFLQISTDEVYGSLENDQPAFTEYSRYQPNNPYSASKAAADHLVRASFQSFGLPVITSICSNNYGQFQHPEKLIPLLVHNALHDKPLPIYGDGRQIRDWIYVDDHCRALIQLLQAGQPGEVYHIGGLCEKTNLEIAGSVCKLLDKLKPRKDGKSYITLLRYIQDRSGHDRRYAIDCSKISRELGWQTQETFTSGLEKTLNWYLANRQWMEDAASGEYHDWINTQYPADQ